MKTKFNFFDAALVAALLSSAAFLFMRKPPASVERPAIVRIMSGDGSVTLSPLDIERVLRLGNGFVVEIKGRRARVLSSDCPKKICEHSGWISRAGESLVCAPKKTAVSIISGDKEYDAITR